MQKASEVLGNGLDNLFLATQWPSCVRTHELFGLKDSEIEELQGIKDDLSSGVSAIASRFVQERLATFREELDELEQFKVTLSEASRVLRQSQGAPLIVIVDELDRCRPSYAVELLERLKHVLSVENVVFVLVCHKAQLEESVRSRYGLGIDANLYLQKFFDIECHLPQKSAELSKNHYQKFCAAMYSKHEFPTWYGEAVTIKALAFMGRTLDLSLRDMQRCISMTLVFCSSIAENYLRDEYIVSLLVALRVRHPEQYQKLKSRELTATGLHELMGLASLEEDHAVGMNLSYFKTLLEVYFPDEESPTWEPESDHSRIAKDLSFRYNSTPVSALRFFVDGIESFQAIRK